MLQDKPILVTGGSGFLGGWIIIKLLNQGFTVRATLKDLKKEKAIRETLAKETNLALDGKRLQFFPARLEKDAGWKEAVQGCAGVIHTASPFPPVQPKHEDDIIRPARDGALRVLRACVDTGVSRVALTSSVAAMEYTKKPQQTPVTETLWTDVNRSDITPYIRSKTLAEQAAWDFAQNNPGHIQLTTIAPGTMLGPILGKHLSYSILAVKQLMDGSAPAIPKLGFGFVDVRDVADLHITALLNSKTVGERLLAGGSFLWLSEVADILRANIHQPGTTIPKRNLPNALVRVLAVFTPSLRTLLNDLNKTHFYSPAKSAKLLGWQMRPIRQTVLDTAQRLLDNGVVVAKKR